jgi:hypothetical protein
MKTWKEFNTQFPAVRHRKVEKAIMFSLQRAEYFLGARVGSDLRHTTSELSSGVLKVYAEQSHQLYSDLFELDARIRAADDLIDEDIMTRPSYDADDVERAIKNFEQELPAAHNIAQLFRDEFNLRYQNGAKDQQLGIAKVIENRMADIDLLIDRICINQGIQLSAEDLKHSRDFLHQWHMFDSIITDLWYIAQDGAKGSFNIFLKAKELNLGCTFIIVLLESIMEQMAHHLNAVSPAHIHRGFLEKAHSNAVSLTKLIYIPLMEDFEHDEDAWYQSLIALKLL